VQPPLRTRADRDGLRAAVKSGVVQAISSHHQPHERDAKLAPFGATEPGMSSVELLLPLAMTLVEDGLLDLPTLLARLSTGPAQALRLPAGKFERWVRRPTWCCSIRALPPWPVKQWHSGATTAHSWAIACQAPCATRWWTVESATKAKASPYTLTPPPACGRGSG
jgi:hypothetical protein